VLKPCQAILAPFAKVKGTPDDPAVAILNAVVPMDDVSDSEDNSDDEDLGSDVASTDKSLVDEVTKDASDVRLAPLSPADKRATHMTITKVCTEVFIFVIITDVHATPCSRCESFRSRHIPTKRSRMLWRGR
jgi:hypothetical protein